MFVIVDECDNGVWYWQKRGCWTRYKDYTQQFATCKQAEEVLAELSTPTAKVCKYK